MKQFMPQGFVENKRVMSQQLIKFKSWVWPRKEIQEGPVKTTAIPG